MGKIAKALLIYPPTGLFMRDDRCQAPVKGMSAQPIRTPLDLAYMAATLEKAGVKCAIKDYPAEGLAWQDFENDLREFRPDMLVISVTTPTMAADLSACARAKKICGDILIVSKGAHYLLKDQEALRQYADLDIIIRGESEFAVAEIATCSGLEQVQGITYRKNGEVLRTADRPFLEDLDSLPFPARHLLRNDLYSSPDTKRPITLIYTGRGCPHQCIFCAVPPVSGHKIKLRSAKSIVDEIQECVERYKIYDFFFRADTFTWNEDWVIEICRLILERKLRIRWGANSRVDTISEKRLEWMKKAGCWIIGFGVESGSQRTLDLMKKKAKVEDALRAVALCRKYGIKTYALFLIGMPWDNLQTVRETAEFAKKLNSDYIDINIAYPLPGTELFEYAKKENLFKEGGLHGYDYAKPALRTKYLTSEELVRLRRAALLGFYLRPGYIMTTLLSAESPGVLWNYIKAGVSLCFKLYGTKLNVEDFREDA